MGNPTTPTTKDTEEKVPVKDSDMEKKEGKEKEAGEKPVPPSIPDYSPMLKHGRWTTPEKLLFLHGLKLFGRGRWKKISTFLPLRSLVQIKSHGQKVLKRADAGEDIWTPLREKDAFLQQLLAKQAKSPGFILPRIPAKASIARPLPKPKLKPRPTTMAFEERTAEAVHFSIGNGRRENEPGPAVFKTQIGSASNLSFSFRDAPQQVEEEETTAGPHGNADASECRTPQRPDPHMMKSTAVLAATALCQLSVGWEEKKSSSSDDTQHVNIVSP